MKIMITSMKCPLTQNPHKNDKNNWHTHLTNLYSLSRNEKINPVQKYWMYPFELFPQKFKHDPLRFLQALGTQRQQRDQRTLCQRPGQQLTQENHFWYLQVILRLVKLEKSNRNLSNSNHQKPDKVVQTSLSQLSFSWSLNFLVLVLSASKREVSSPIRVSLWGIPGAGYTKPLMNTGP